MAVKTRKVDLSGGKRITKAKQAEQERLAKELKAANTKRLFNEISAAEAAKKAGTTKSTTNTTKKSATTKKQYPDFNVVSRSQQKKKVDKVTGNGISSTKSAKPSFNTYKDRKADKITGNKAVEYPETPGEYKNRQNYLKRKGLKK